MQPRTGLGPNSPLARTMHPPTTTYLDVAVHHTLLVAVLQRAQQLPRHHLGHARRHDATRVFAHFLCKRGHARWLVTGYAA